MKKTRLAEGAGLGRDGEYLFTVHACPIANVGD